MTRLNFVLEDNYTHCFLKLFSGLKKMSHLQVKSLSGLVKINRHLTSEGAKINISVKLDSLNKLRDFVFQDWIGTYHLDIAYFVEYERISASVHQNIEDRPQ